MPFKLVISDTVIVPVEGSIPDASGRKVPFSFRLVCKRLPADQLKSAIESTEVTVPDFLAGIVQGWEAVQDDDGKDLTYTAAGFQALCNIVGMAGVMFTAYMNACGAKGKEKN